MMPTSGTGSILIVDDEATLVETICDHFAAEGLEAVSARSAEEALALAGARDFDVVVTDLKMAGMGGLELLRALGEMRKPPSVILMTAYGTMEAAIEAFRLGLSDFLQKPVLLDELSRSVQRALGARAARAKRDPSPSPLCVLREHSRRVGAVRAEVAGDPSAAGATAVWRLRALDGDRTAFIWGHVVPRSRFALGARVIIRTLAEAVDLGAPAEAVEAIAGHLRELGCGSALAALAVGVLESKPGGRVHGAARGRAGVFRLGAGGRGTERLADGPRDMTRTWETTLAAEDMLLLADPRMVSAAGAHWSEVLSSAGRLVAEGEWNPARRVLGMTLGMAPAVADEAAVVVGLRLGEAIRPEGPTHVRVSSSPAGLSHSRDVAERFALGVPLSERAVHELVTAVQEAVLNCVRWAYPAREGPVYLTLAREAGRIRASVRDRGVGFDVGETFRRTTGPGREALRCAGRGLTLMQRLADRFELTSRPGRGTNVVLEKFLDEPAAGRVPHGEAGRV